MNDRYINLSTASFSPYNNYVNILILCPILQIISSSFPPFISRQLCILLNAEDIYLTLSEILVIYNDARFSCQMVHTLNSILLTSTELFELRNQLKELKTEVKLVIFGYFKGR